MEPPPSPHGIGAVCCMCGDRGLPQELLRCKLCRVRLQHRYCSDLYPRATAYRRCNWCLREPAAQVYAHAMSSNKPTEKRKAVAATTSTSTSEEEGERRQLHQAGCAATRSSRPATEVGQPLKKHKADALPPSPGATKGNNGNRKQKADEREELPPSPGATAKGNNGNKKQKTNERAELPPSPGATAKGNNGNNKQKPDERAELPPSPGATAKGNNGEKKPMQVGKLTRPGRVKARRYKLLAEVISC